MDDNKLNIATHLDDFLIDLDASFAFKCRRCGKCCENRDDIVLSTNDLFNIALKLNLTIHQVIEKYCEVYVGRESHLPVVRLKPRGKRKSCPLLDDGRCSVHDHKPAVCALFPLGRVYMHESNESTDIAYIITPIRCGSAKRSQTVREWLERFGIPGDDPFFVLWYKTLVKLSLWMRAFEKRDVTQEKIDVIEDILFSALYVDYDTGCELLPQFTLNMEKLQIFLETLEEIVPPVIENPKE